MTAETWLLVGDLHLAPSAPDERDVATALPSFIRQVVSAQVGSAEAGAIHLALLGDTFDLDPTPPAPAERGASAEVSLQQIACRFDGIFAELRNVLDEGSTLR